jgi:non-specific serine/threonine protein kinase
MQKALMTAGPRLEAEPPATETDAEYIWRFGSVVFDEGRWELRVGNNVVEIEPKPLEMLGLLLRHAGEVVTKEELLAFLWPGVIVVEKALTNAVSKLRRAIGDGDQRVIVTVHRIGYRFVAPATRKAIQRNEGPRPQLGLGDALPNRPQWRLERLLASADGSDVWLATHEKTRQQRVFKLAYSGHRLAGLKREATLSRVLGELLGSHPGIVQLHEWNFEEPPFFLECEYGGRNWLEWAAAGHLAGLSCEARVGLVLQAARAVAAAHGVGVMHKDLKPANLLIEPDAAGGWRVQLTDFGCGRMLDPGQLEALGLTRLGATVAAAEDQSGTLLYMPPEMLAGHLPMPSADVYALGILLYQVLAGDLRRPLATGWEHDIDDPLLREDIAAATHGNPARRMQTALELVTRLESLEQRRRERAAEQQAAEQARHLRRELELARVRKPWVLGLAASVLIGAVTGAVYLHRAVLAEHRAEAERQRAEVINGFLVSDLLSAADPVQAGKRDVTVIDAVRKSTADIDRRLAQQPQVAAVVHMTAARAYGHLGAYRDAAEQYARAAQLLHGLGQPLAGEAMAADILQVMSMVDDGQVKPATTRLGELETTLDRARADSPEIRMLSGFVRGKLAIQSADYKAARGFQEIALAAAGQVRDSTELPQERQELLASLRKDYAFTLEQTGDAAKAVGVMRERLAADQALLGPDHTQVLIDKLELAEAMDTESPPDPAGEALIEQVLPGLDRALGPQNGYKAQALDELGSWAMNHRDWPRAVDVFGQAYDLAVQMRGPQDQRSLVEAFNLGYVLERANRPLEAHNRLGAALQLAQAQLGPATPMAQVIAYMLANADLALGRDAEARGAAQNLSVAALGSVEPDNDWQARLALLQAELAYSGERGDSRRQQLASALAAIAASHDDDREYLYRQGNALLAQAGSPAGGPAGTVVRRR